MTITTHTSAQLTPSDDDRDVAIARVGEFDAVTPRRIEDLDHEIALRDACVELGAVLQAHLPAGPWRELAWEKLEQTFLVATNAVTIEPESR